VAGQQPQGGGGGPSLRAGGDSSEPQPEEGAETEGVGETAGQASHRDPNKVADALAKGAKGIYKMRGETPGFRDAWSWLGDMLRDATGLSGSFYKDPQLTKLKDKLYKLDFELGQAATEMEVAAKRIKKEHAENERKKKGDVEGAGDDDFGKLSQHLVKKFLSPADLKKWVKPMPYMHRMDFLHKRNAPGDLIQKVEQFRSELAKRAGGVEGAEASGAGNPREASLDSWKPGMLGKLDLGGGGATYFKPDSATVKMVPRKGKGLVGRSVTIRKGKGTGQIRSKKDFVLQQNFWLWSLVPEKEVSQHIVAKL